MKVSNGFIQKLGKKIFPFVLILCMGTGCGGCSRNQAGTEVTLSSCTEAEDSVNTGPTGTVDAGTVDASTSDESTTSQNTDREAEEQGGLYVYICGAVKHPGVYHLPAGSRVYEVIEEAGGLKKKADETAVNQAELLTDGQQVNIPYKSNEGGTKETLTESSAGDGSAESEASGETSAKVNLNTAGADELKTLTGIGDSKASAIIQYRTEHGGFSSIEEIMQIDGIKEGVYNKIKDQITI